MSSIVSPADIQQLNYYYYYQLRKFLGSHLSIYKYFLVQRRNTTGDAQGALRLHSSAAWGTSMYRKCAWRTSDQTGPNKPLSVAELIRRPQNSSKTSKCGSELVPFEGVYCHFKMTGFCESKKSTGNATLLKMAINIEIFQTAIAIL